MLVSMIPQGTRAGAALTGRDRGEFLWGAPGRMGQSPTREVRMATQQELTPQPREIPEDDMDEMYEEEPRRRAWGAIASVVLALALVFVGCQRNQAATRAETLGAQVNGLRAEAEPRGLRAED